MKQSAPLNKQTREEVYKKYDGRCAYCGKEILYKDMQVDHIRSKRNFYFGDVKEIPDYDVDDIQNLNPACRRCNGYKNTYSLEEFRTQLLTIHERICKNGADKVAIDYGIIEVIPFDGKFYFEKIRERQGLNKCRI